MQSRHENSHVRLPRTLCSVGTCLYFHFMTKVQVKMNDDGMRKLFEEIAANLDAADQRFRQTHEGYPFDVVRKDEPASLSSTAPTRS